MRIPLISLFSFIAGTVLGVLLILLFGILPLRFDNPLVEQLGIARPQVIGFAPYWLLDKEADSYSRYLTTYTYFGLIVGPDGKIVRLVNPTEQEPGWTTLGLDKLDQKLTRAKKDNLKLSLLVQSGKEDDIAGLISDPVVHANNLLGDVSSLMRKYGFTDLNLDIESFVDTSPSAQIQFTEFVRQVKEGLDQQKLGTLTVELTPYSLIRTRLTDPAAIGELADSVVLMAYDYSYSGSFLAGPVAPLTGAGTVRPFDVEQSVIQSLRIIPPDKLILGIPLYGYQWETVASASGSPVIPGTGMTASSRRVSGILADCPDCITGTDPTGLEPYIISPAEAVWSQIYYEDKNSLAVKLDLAKKYKLGGVAFWALGYEDDSILTPVAGYKKWWTVR